MIATLVFISILLGAWFLVTAGFAAWAVYELIKTEARNDVLSEKLENL